jgi:carbamoyltransferase
MKPHEHEYKLMGLAPYADAAASARAAARFAELIGLDGGGLGFRAPYSTRMALRFIEDRCREFRFDVLAGGLQAHTEELLVRWAGNALAAAGGAHALGLGGGVFMNVKANQRIAELEGVDQVLPVPGCGDESLALGALAWWQVRAGGPVHELESLALGPDYSEAAVGQALDGSGLRISRPRSLEAAVALLLAEGEVVARFDGRMEFGARALGQRSILAHPGRRELVTELNTQIKNRDFWMPFAPSILEREASRYIVNPKALPAPHMMLTFPSSERGRSELAAAVHPADFTTRPQLVGGATPYGRLIEAFRRRTGTAAVLNTSFNLHGEPIVCSPEDAVSTLLRSGLKHLAIGPYLVSKPAGSELGSSATPRASARATR